MLSLEMANMAMPSGSRRFEALSATRLSLPDATPPLYRLKTPSHQIAVVLTALAERLDPSEARRVFGYRQATITSLSAPPRPSTRRLYTSALFAPCSSHISSWPHSEPGC